MTGNPGGPFSHEGHRSQCWNASLWPCPWPRPPLLLPFLQQTCSPCPPTVPAGCPPAQAETAQQQTSIICIPDENKRVRLLETASTHTWEYFPINVFTYMLFRCFWLVSSGLACLVAVENDNTITGFSISYFLSSAEKPRPQGFSSQSLSILKTEFSV